MSDGARGLSLLELVVAMALFAMVAVMGMQALSGTVRSRDALSDRDGRDRALAVALALLRSDLDRAAPMIFFPPGQPPQSAVRALAGRGEMALSVATLPQPGAVQTAFARVEWRHDAAQSTLTRRSWPVVAPAEAAQAGPTRVVLTGVTELRLRSFRAGQGWAEGAGESLQGNAGASRADGDALFALRVNAYTDAQPDAVEVILRLEDLGELRLFEVLR